MRHRAFLRCRNFIKLFPNPLTKRRPCCTIMTEVTDKTAHYGAHMEIHLTGKKEYLRGDHGDGRAVHRARRPQGRRTAAQRPHPGAAGWGSTRTPSRGRITSWRTRASSVPSPRRGCSPARRTSALPSRRRRARASSCSARRGSRSEDALALIGEVYRRISSRSG